MSAPTPEDRCSICIGGESQIWECPQCGREIHEVDAALAAEREAVGELVEDAFYAGAGAMIDHAEMSTATHEKLKVAWSEWKSRALSALERREEESQ
jgi:hypothetical protein